MSGMSEDIAQVLTTVNPTTLLPWKVTRGDG